MLLCTRGRETVGFRVGLGLGWRAAFGTIPLIVQLTAQHVTTMMYKYS